MFRDIVSIFLVNIIKFIYSAILDYITKKNIFDILRFYKIKDNN
jgi:hypothetical protein